MSALDRHGLGSAHSLWLLCVIALTTTGAMGCEAVGMRSEPVPAVLLAPAMAFTCGDFKMDPGILDAPGNDERGPSPMAAALRRLLASPDNGLALPQTGWHLIGATVTSADFVAIGHTEQVVMVSVLQQGGEWRAISWGTCQLHSQNPFGNGFTQADWVLDPAGPPLTAATRSFQALVFEPDCSDLGPEGRMVGPRITSLDDRVIVQFGFQELGPGGHECAASNPRLAVLVDLEEPLGNRRLVNPWTWPVLEYPAGGPAPS